MKMHKTVVAKHEASNAIPAKLQNKKYANAPSKQNRRMEHDASNPILRLLSTRLYNVNFYPNFAIILFWAF
jgi:hypothetical protein